MPRCLFRLKALRCALRRSPGLLPRRRTCGWVEGLDPQGMVNLGKRTLDCLCLHLRASSRMRLPGSHPSWGLLGLGLGVFCCMRPAQPFVTLPCPPASRRVAMAMTQRHERPLRDTLPLPRHRGVLRAALTVGAGDEETPGSVRLKKARLRLAEAQGIIPAGSSERYQTSTGLKVRQPLPSHPPQCCLSSRSLSRAYPWVAVAVAAEDDQGAGPDVQGGRAGAAV
jgi:hypothetical protein